jgi:hypothetical protein
MHLTSSGGSMNTGINLLLLLFKVIMQKTDASLVKKSVSVVGVISGEFDE